MLDIGTVQRFLWQNLYNHVSIDRAYEFVKKKKKKGGRPASENKVWPICWLSVSCGSYLDVTFSNNVHQETVIPSRQRERERGTNIDLEEYTTSVWSGRLYHKGRRTFGSYPLKTLLNLVYKEKLGSLVWFRKKGFVFVWRPTLYLHLKIKMLWRLF